jgi:hypothetical protein
VENYFNYFTEIEEHFQRRRGSVLLLSTIDWALIEVWKDAGIPLEAVLRGVDTAFDRYDQRPSKSKKVNCLAFCAQEVLAAAEEMKEAAVGAPSPEKQKREPPGFSNHEIAAFLRKNAAALETGELPESPGVSGKAVARQVAEALRRVADEIDRLIAAVRLEDLERQLTVLEEKLFAVLLAATPDEQIVNVRAQADRDLVPYRSKMPSAQIGQLQKQYVHKRLLEKYGLPRLSLFYM